MKKERPSEKEREERPSEKGREDEETKERKEERPSEKEREERPSGKGREDAKKKKKIKKGGSTVFPRISAPVECEIRNKRRPPPSNKRPLPSPLLKKNCHK